MNVPLSDFKSECGVRQKTIVSREKLNRHIAQNVDNCSVRQLKIDGYAITENIKKCDYLVLNDDKCTAYFIELKGRDISGAINQIENTVVKLKKYLNAYNIQMRIVYSGKVNSGTISAWQIKNKNAKAGRNKFEENI